MSRNAFNKDSHGRSGSSTKVSLALGGQWRTKRCVEVNHNLKNRMEETGNALLKIAPVEVNVVADSWAEI
jgi:hypothetical protein